MRLVESLRGVGIFNPVNRRGNRPRFRIVTSVYPSSLGGGGDQLPLFLDVRSVLITSCIYFVFRRCVGHRHQLCLALPFYRILLRPELLDLYLRTSLRRFARIIRSIHVIPVTNKRIDLQNLSFVSLIWSFRNHRRSWFFPKRKEGRETSKLDLSFRSVFYMSKFFRDNFGG